MFQCSACSKEFSILHTEETLIFLNKKIRKMSVNFYFLHALFYTISCIVVYSLCIKNANHAFLIPKMLIMLSFALAGLS